MKVGFFEKNGVPDTFFQFYFGAGKHSCFSAIAELKQSKQMAIAEDK
ncbi:MAG TPA: hypothetical protein PK855_07635 [Bacteroidales bacterium]|nr:hypothetical protein [Bacteroidales bacterium]